VHRFRMPKIRISPALVVASIALFVALAGTGVAANVVPLAKRALKADKAKVATTAQNSLKLNGLTAEQVSATPGPATDAQTLNGQTAAQIAATPGPAASVPASLITLRSRGWSVQNEGDKTQEKVLCQTGEKALGGGYDIANGYANPVIDAPLPDLTGWQFKVWALSGNNVPANGSVWVVCAKVS
jgi:hypothetical protein